jgi:hypothetical protein
VPRSLPFGLPRKTAGRQSDPAFSAQTAQNGLKSPTYRACLEGEEARQGNLPCVPCAAEREVELSRIMDVTRHRDVRIVTVNVRRANLFKGHAGSGFM